MQLDRVIIVFILPWISDTVQNPLLSQLVYLTTPVPGDILSCLFSGNKNSSLRLTLSIRFDGIKVNTLRIRSGLSSDREISRVLRDGVNGWRAKFCMDCAPYLSCFIVSEMDLGEWHVKFDMYHR